jgi:hypothetical protein
VFIPSGLASDQETSWHKLVATSRKAARHFGDGQIQRHWTAGEALKTEMFVKAHNASLTIKSGGSGEVRMQGAKFVCKVSR